MSSNHSDATLSAQPESAAIVQLNELFTLQKRSAYENPYPLLEERLDWLDRLEKMMVANRRVFIESLESDFGSHPSFVTDLLETAAIMGRVRFFRRKLEEWMSPTDISLNPHAHGSSTAATIPVPYGVVGNIAPWNFPVECALVMVVDMLAAGNRVILKPSPQAPASAKAVGEAVAEFFPEDVFATVNGGNDLTEAFPHKPWDHLTYTGSPAVGKIIMRAAAENLTPVTLELGGKNPTVFAEDAIDDKLIKRFLDSRILKGGQVCTSPDYVFVPRAKRDEWVERAQRIWTEMYPSYVGHADATGVINESHFKRVVGYVEEARAVGTNVISLNGEEYDEGKRQIPMYVVVDPSPELAVMTEEIFGPVTSICSYDSFDEVIATINAGHSPLASYLATYDQELTDKFVRKIKSGGVAINNFGSQAGNPSIPFGGVGNSGMGCHSGYEGFLNYSHVKGIFYGSDDSMVVKAMELPYGEMGQALVKGIFR
ncbi:MAG: aldehyde dehydrogenase family protein [Gammaproteobacteria bacterium]|nr:aldehyde dehydrogenase family protein [Gammaproteobacteria bacterium]